MILRKFGSMYNYVLSLYMAGLPRNERPLLGPLRLAVVVSTDHRTIRKAHSYYCAYLCRGEAAFGHSQKTKLRQS